MMTTVTDRIVRFSRDVAATVLLVSLALNFVNVVGRYFFNAPIEWAEEVMLFLMVAIVFFGASYVSWKGRQIAMDLLVIMLPAGLQRAVRLFVLSIEVAVPLVIVWIGAPVVFTLWNFDQRSEAADIPLAIPQAVIPLGLLLVAVVSAVRITAALFTSRVSLRSGTQDKLAALR